jgi:hypothetical protein
MQMVLTGDYDQNIGTSVTKSDRHNITNAVNGAVKQSGTRKIMTVTELYP